MALLLPDVCGKACYPNKKPRDRYVDWYNEFITKKFKEYSIGVDVFDLKSEVVYGLRSCIVHEGNTNISNNKYNIEYFELLWQPNRTIKTINERTSTVSNDLDGKENHTNIHISIDITYLCKIICNTVEEYYRNNKEKFNFFNYNIKEMAKEERKIFKLKK